MAAISAADVKKLRDTTGAGMMDCKKALTQAEGDFAAAEKILKEMGLAAVAKRQDRATENGRVFVASNGKKVVMLSLTCETDFVASNADFLKLGNDLCAVILEKGYTEINDELTGMVNGLIAIIKENMTLEKFTVTDIPANGYASTYTHGNGMVVVSIIFTSDKPEAFANEAVKELTHDLALHVAAYKPTYLSDKVVDKAYEDEQLGIFKVLVDQDPKLAGKPDMVKEKAVMGKLSKLYKEICFMNQPFVKDDTKSCAQAIADCGKAVGAKLEVASFSVFQAGLK